MNMPYENHEQKGELHPPAQVDKAPRDESETTDATRGGDKLRRLSKRLRVKLQRRRGESSKAHNDQRMFDVTTLAPTLAPAPSPTTQKDRFSGERQEKPSIPSLREVIAKPVETLKSLAHKKGGNEFAESVANTDASHGASVNLVLAHERIVASINDQERLKATKKFAALKQMRQESFVRWTMDRHVRKVKNAQAQRIPLLDKKDFVRNGKMHWLDYGHHVRCTFLYPKSTCQTSIIQ